LLNAITNGYSFTILLLFISIYFNLSFFNNFSKRSMSLFLILLINNIFKFSLVPSLNLFRETSLLKYLYLLFFDSSFNDVLP
ncbi:hypothetical protein H8356DRAFT_1752899, partial [Neocallimastix lanati (nom. inval.)]